MAHHGVFRVFARAFRGRVGTVGAVAGRGSLAFAPVSGTLLAASQQVACRSLGLGFASPEALVAWFML
jgi:hypothetical protein